MHTYIQKLKTFLTQKTHTLIVAGVLLVILVIILIIVFSKSSGNTPEFIDLDQEQELVDGFEGIPTRPMQVFTEGEFTYSFDGIKWIVEADDEPGVGIPLTRLAWTLDNFSRRRDGIPVTLRNPFRLGTIIGNCEERNRLTYNARRESGIPLAYMQCSVPSRGEIIDYAIFQENHTLVVKMRTQSLGDSPRPFEKVSSFNLTQLVRP
ncbi:MAG: hypothetical protein LRY41_00150 [Candidatus Pacebacteria bacterium]|nr:hypothetical protein [Candidatus Paceibacterota bacterium]MCD8508271.1 hypothetical protein [Candidatus Paceibacterota bacterium]MCD8527747.1 hypothetical protein [Candidatus Paceibacterota bacterium]MCD8563497.1 hypothetical protein [Candidatus Paceibacterota bacterium]